MTAEERKKHVTRGVLQIMEALAEDADEEMEEDDAQVAEGIADGVITIYGGLSGSQE